MKPLICMTLIVSIFLGGCAEEKMNEPVDVNAYKVSDLNQLQARYNQLNTKLAADFKQFKQVENIAFSNQYPLDTNNLKTLNIHLVASTALKPTKIAYCDLMNGYFTEMYRLGHYNLNLVNGLKLPYTDKENLRQDFSTTEQFYDFILNRYTTYRQVQEVMGYGCNLKAALE